jgi:hypothetical protein
MRHHGVRQLDELDEHAGQRGKYLQLVLAAAFQRAGAKVTDTHVVEGYDLEFDFEDDSYGLEVKTTTSDVIKLKEKDLDDVEQIRNKGRRAGFAVLSLSGDPRWWISKPTPALIEKMRSGGKTHTLPMTAFRAHPWPSLQEAAQEEFPDALDEAVGAMDRGDASSLDDLRSALDLEDTG